MDAVAADCVLGVRQTTPASQKIDSAGAHLPVGCAQSQSAVGLARYLLMSLRAPVVCLSLSAHLIHNSKPPAGTRALAPAPYSLPRSNPTRAIYSLHPRAPHVIVSRDKSPCTIFSHINHGRLLKSPRRRLRNLEKEPVKIQQVYKSPAVTHQPTRAHTTTQQTHQRILRPMSRCSEPKLEMLEAKWRR